MGSAVTIILAVAALGVVQIAVRMALRRYLPLGRGGRDRGQLSRAVDLRALTRRLYRLVASVADDVGEHQTRIEQVSKELASLPAPDESALTGVFLDTVSRAIQINERLQSRLSAAEERLQEQTDRIESHLYEARTDALTGLPNRRAFDDELGRRIAEWQRKQTTFSLVMVDVDHFKALNDRFGHPAGDHVLRRVGDLLRSTLREMDMAARFGGEEFSIILPSTPCQDAKRAAERVRTAIATHQFDFEQDTLHVTVSLGLAEVGPDDDAESLLRKADEALYLSKRAGRNCGHFHTGKTCERILAGSRASGGRAGDSDLTDGADRGEFEMVCDDLRRRLVEVTNEP